ncbi:MAG: DNA replication/repair protein RecF, partial [Candidatus Saccharimonadales bacterium]
MLKSIKLTNFRSYKGRGFNFSKGVNLIVGPNGSGKTNILEAIYVLGMSKGFRGSSEQICRGGDNWFRVEGEFKTLESSKIAISYQDGEKKIVVNDKKLLPSEYIGLIPVVLFEPNSLSLVGGPPATRRQWIDRVLSLTNKEYLRSLMKYRKVLTQRNALLRRSNLVKDQIFAWDVIMSEYGEYVVNKRRQFLEEISPLFTNHYQQISKSKDKLEIEYKSNIDANGNYRDELLSQLQIRVIRDSRMGGTSVGPHRDDIDLSYNNKSLSQYGSRGEYRTAVLAMVLAELEYLKKSSSSSINGSTNNSPILLLDDVLSEL